MIPVPQSPLGSFRLAVGVGVVSTALAACGGNVPVCSPGEMIVDGSVDEELLDYERPCEAACWSFPFDELCADACVPIDLAQPNGMLVLDRRLMLAQIESATQRRARIFRFGYVDELGGEAPKGWGFLSEGRRSYMGNTLDGSARFVIELAAAGVGARTGVLSYTPAYTAKSGRLEILLSSPTRISGRFFIGVDSPTQQPGGELLGCFNFAVSNMIGNVYQLLTAN